MRKLFQEKILKSIRILETSKNMGMWIKCSECKTNFELSKDYAGADFLTKCPRCDSFLFVEVKINVKKVNKS